MHSTLLFSLFLHFNVVHSATRVYYIAVEEDIWDYAPNGNLIYTGDSMDTELYLKLDKDIPLPGTKFKKSMYRGYTDDTFTRRTEDPAWQGMVGPLIRAEVGDTLVVHFKNNATHPFTIHPHGVFYNKDSEGAFYLDGTNGTDKLDDRVMPGENYTYVWVVHPDYGPTPNDPPCISWLYHSHNEAEIEVMSGALGILATCKPNTLDEHGNIPGVKDFALLFAIMDENFSFYRSENTISSGIDPENAMKHFLVWQKANQKSSINGYLYGNLPGLEVCEHDKVNLYIAVIGNDHDLHTVYVQGQTMSVLRQRVTTVGLYPGSSQTAIIESAHAGKWILSCQSRAYIQSGMQAFFNVKKCNNKKKNEDVDIIDGVENGNISSSKHYNNYNNRGRVRNYYIAAEEHIWKYAPSGFDKTTGIALSITAPQNFGKSSENECRLNGTYKKALFVGYSDRSFRNPIKREGNDRHLGFLGPLIEAEVGDRVNVYFWNRASKPYSIQIDRYYGNVNQQGIQYKGGPKVAVQPNETRSYSWIVPKSVGPTKYDSDCLLGRYYSSVDQVKDTHSGLSGPTLVCKKGKLNRKSKKNYDRRFFLSFFNVAETESHYFEENVKRACGPNINASKLLQNESFVNNSRMRSINGYSYGNLPGLDMRQGEKILWFVMAIGSAEFDVHTPYFHGNTFVVNKMRADTFPLIPDLYETLVMEPDNPGVWIIEDDVHVESNELGMKALYKVDKSNHKSKQKRGKVRTFYIGAVEKEWNYAPNLTINPINGEPMTEGIASVTYVKGDHTIGHKYIKAMYREFTDDSFATEKERGEDTKHLGTLGPYIKAEVGDTIRVVFKNFASFNFSIQPHGVFYNYSNEGEYYLHGKKTPPQPGDAVPPGKMYTYEWYVPKRAGPGKNDFDCVFWYYKSAVNGYSDGHAGLFGPMVICKPGLLNETGHRKDVNREYVLYYQTFNENGSPYLKENIEKYTGKPKETFELIGERDFFESNVKMTINGYMYGSIRNVWLYLGEIAAFYMVSWSDPFSTHTIHFHGNTFIRQYEGKHRHDVMDVLPSQITQVELVGINVGDWLMHCHVNNHSESGMFMTYQVKDPDRIYHPIN